MHSPQVCGSSLAFLLMSVNVITSAERPLYARHRAWCCRQKRPGAGMVELRVSWENQALMKQKQRRLTN